MTLIENDARGELSTEPVPPRRTYTPICAGRQAGSAATTTAYINRRNNRTFDWTG